jgi:hypothetical protein
VLALAAERAPCTSAIRHLLMLDCLSAATSRPVFREVIKNT